MAGRPASSVILQQTTRVITAGTQGVVAATATPWTIRFRIPICNMHHRNEMQSIVLPVMRVISKEKEITLVERTALSNKIRIVLAAVVIGSLIVNFNGCRKTRGGWLAKTKPYQHFH